MASVLSPVQSLLFQEQTSPILPATFCARLRHVSRANVLMNKYVLILCLFPFRCYSFQMGVNAYCHLRRVISEICNSYFRGEKVFQVSLVSCAILKHDPTRPSRIQMRVVCRKIKKHFMRQNCRSNPLAPCFVFRCTFRNRCFPVFNLV